MNEEFSTGDDFTYLRSNEGDIKVDQIIKDVPYKLSNQKGRNKPQVYHIEKVHIEELKTTAANQLGISK